MSPTRAIACATAVVGTLDAIDAIVFFGLRGTTPVRIFQGIAAGLLGRASFSDGLPAAVLGLFIHYFVAFGIVVTYFAASRRLRLLTARPVMCGAVYGVLAYVVMNRVVIPLSAIGPGRFVLGAPFFNGILIHIFGVGIPAALFAARTGAGAASSPARSHA